MTPSDSQQNRLKILIMPDEDYAHQLDIFKIYSNSSPLKKKTIQAGLENVTKFGDK